MGWAYQALPFPLCKTNQSLVLAPAVLRVGNHRCDSGNKRGEFKSHTFAQTIHLVELRAAGKDREELIYDKIKNISSPFSCLAMVSMRRKFGSSSSKTCGKLTQTVQVKSFKPGNSTLLLLLLLDIVTHYHDISKINSDYLKYRNKTHNTILI